MENWATIISSQIDNKLRNIKKRDWRFYRIDEFKRNIKRIDIFSANCPVCQSEKENIDDVITNIDEAINVPGKSRRQYDRVAGRIATHMQKEHGFYSPYYFVYLLSFFGMLIGLVIGYLLMKLFPAHDWAMLSLAFFVGLLVGYIWGSVKDKKIREDNRLM